MSMWDMLSTQVFDPPMLRQQSFEDRPPKHVVRQSGPAASWWGVDPGTERVAVARVTAEGWDVRTLSFPIRWRDPGDRMRVIQSTTLAWLNELEREWGLPSMIFFEEPFIPREHRQKFSLPFACGALLAAFGHMGRLELIGQQSWKLGGLGYGAAKKPAVMAWARDVGYRGSLQDEADALGIAVACMRSVEIRA